MIKFTGEIEGKPLYGFGLSEANIRELKRGRPIYINFAEMGGEGQILIFYGKTEQSMIAELEKLGLIESDLLIQTHGDTHS